MQTVDFSVVELEPYDFSGAGDATDGLLQREQCLMTWIRGRPKGSRMDPDRTTVLQSWYL
jgi:hypothetical protein